MAVYILWFKLVSCTYTVSLHQTRENHCLILFIFASHFEAFYIHKFAIFLHIPLPLNGINFLCTLVNILREELADGCTLISYGVLITFQGSNPTGTSALISYIKLNNMSFLNNTHQVENGLENIGAIDLNDILVNY